MYTFDLVVCIVIFVLVCFNLFNWKFYLLLYVIFIVFISSYFIQQYLLSKINPNVDDHFVIKHIKDKLYSINYHSMTIFFSVYDKKFNNQDIVKIKGVISLKDNLTYFDLSNKSFFKIKISEINWVSKYIYSFDKIFNLHSTYSKSYLKLLMFGIKDNLGFQIYNKIKELNIAHLFVISGFHIGILYFILSKLLNKLKIKYITEIIIFVCLLMYLYFLNFSISSLRAFLFIYLLKINNGIFKKKFNSIDILCFTAFILIALNCYVIFDLSFILSFSITFMILIHLQLIKGIKNLILKQVVFILLTYLTSLLLSITIFNQISVLGLFNQLVFTPILILTYCLIPIFLYSKFLSEAYFYIFDSFINILHESNVLIHNSIHLYEYTLFIDVFYFLYVYINKIKSRNKTYLHKS
ncbi:ComEC/Rec2-related protein [Metamycoplasma cloacale]|nr:ComEC/Rec2 family competence protein [Metamycoplasma cloacale]VEU79371.1 ComEC/Rec2-related protein [Metamycoplasma cloacale]